MGMTVFNLFAVIKTFLSFISIVSPGVPITLFNVVDRTVLGKTEHHDIAIFRILNRHNNLASKWHPDAIDKFIVRADDRRSGE